MDVAKKEGKLETPEREESTEEMLSSDEELALPSEAEELAWAQVSVPESLLELVTQLNAHKNTPAYPRMLEALKKNLPFIHQAFDDEAKHADVASVVASYVPLLTCGDKTPFRQIVVRLLTLLREPLVPPYIWQALGDVFLLSETEWIEPVS